MGAAEIQAQLLARSDRLCRWIGGRIPPELASLADPEDILQEVFAAAFRSPSVASLRTAADWDQWLVGVAKKRIALLRRTSASLKRRPERLIAENMVSNIFDLLESPDRSPSRVVSAKEAGYAVRVALASLPSAWRTVIEMRYIQGRTPTQIAKELNKSKPAIEGLLVRGLSRLKERLGEGCRYLSGAPSSS